jgi:cell division protein FtsB
MLKVEIAGLAITYRNAAELNAKVRQELSETQADRLDLEAECRDLRKKEKALERFLGDPPKAEITDETGGSHAK